MADSFGVPAPEHGLTYVDELPRDKDASEVAGFVLTGRAGDSDVLLWTCAYGMRGTGANQWLVQEAKTNATIFFAIPGSSEAMQDNNFARRGLQLAELLPPDGMHVDKSAEQISWEVAGRRYTWRQGAWALTGSHAGVETDLSCRALAPPLWTFGPLENSAENNMGGYDVAVRAEGTIRAGGKTYQLEGAVGSHERAVTGQGRDIMAELAAGEVFVGDCFADDVHIFFARHPGRPVAFGRLDMADTSAMFPSETGEGVVHVTPVSRWHDPRSGLFVPDRWHVSMTSPAASVDLDISYRGRGYWHYTTRSGVMILMWLLGRASGTVYQPGQPARALQDALVCSRWGQTILIAEETVDGPEFPVLREGP